MRTTLTFSQQCCLLLILLLHLVAFQSCTQVKKTKDREAIPALKLRHDALGSAEEAEAVLNAYDRHSTALKEDASNAGAAVALAELFMNEARVTGEHGYYFPAAANLLEPLLAREDVNEGDRFMALTLYAGVMASQHRFDVALEHAEKAIALNPYNAAVRGIQVDAFVELGLTDQAVKACDAMVALRPDLKSYSRVSYLREQHGDLPGAIEAMELAASAGAPGSEAAAWCRTNLAALLAEADRMEEAEYHLQLALEQRTDYPFALAGLADLRIMQGEPEEAENLLKQALAIIPEIGFAEQLLALYRAEGRDKEAAAMVTEVLAMFEDDRVHGHIINWDLAQFHAAFTGDWQAALDEAEEALAQRPNHPEIQEFVADAKAQQAMLAGR
ncbi:MAG: hypothetical protein GC205_11180 [Bacteroidetes bacterium]|nr:hypothetical protein [Bacteroidota bacterium]